MKWFQSAQKWLKDRKKRTLTNSDIEHYQKIIVALSETERLMKEIDKVKFYVTSPEIVLDRPVYC